MRKTYRRDSRRGTSTSIIDTVRVKQEAEILLQWEVEETKRMSEFRINASDIFEFDLNTSTSNESFAEIHSLGFNDSMSEVQIDDELKLEDNTSKVITKENNPQVISNNQCKKKSFRKPKRKEASLNLNYIV